MMNRYISEARQACIDLCDAIENSSEGMTEPSPLESPADALMLGHRLIKTARLVLEGTPPDERRDEVVEGLAKLAADIKANSIAGGFERGYKIYRVYPEFPKTKPAPRHLADAPTLADAERLVADLVAASKPDKPRHYRIVERADRVVSESGA